jgi:hypothetical protein
MPGGDVLRLYLLQLHSTSKDDQLVADGVVVLQKLVDLHPDLLPDEGIELRDMQIVLYNLHQKQQGLRHLVDLILNDYLIADYSKISNDLVAVVHYALLLQSVEEYAGFEVIGYVVSDSMIFIS